MQPIELKNLCAIGNRNSIMTKKQLRQIIVFITLLFLIIGLIAGIPLKDLFIILLLSIGLGFLSSLIMAVLIDLMT